MTGAVVGTGIHMILEKRIGCSSGMPMPVKRSAIIYSIIESCRRYGIEAYAYLHDFLTRLPSMTNRQIKDIVPKAWAAATRKTRLRAA